jgi:hypothetical protein
LFIFSEKILEAAERSKRILVKFQPDEKLQERLSFLSALALKQQGEQSVTLSAARKRKADCCRRNNSADNQQKSQTGFRVQIYSSDNLENEDAKPFQR